MTPVELDRRAFSLFRESLGRDWTVDAAYERWNALSFARREEWRGRALATETTVIDAQATHNDDKWSHVTARLKRTEKAVLERAARNNSVTLSAYIRSILVDAVQDELERAARGAVAPSPVRGVPAATQSSPDPV